MSRDRKATNEVQNTEDTVEDSAEVAVTVEDEEIIDSKTNLVLPDLVQIEQEHIGNGGDYISVDGYRIPVDVYNKLKLGE